MSPNSIWLQIAQIGLIEGLRMTIARRESNSPRQGAVEAEGRLPRRFADVAILLHVCSPGYLSIFDGKFQTAKSPDGTRLADRVRIRKSGCGYAFP